MKHIKGNWIFSLGRWEFTFQVGLRSYRYETWDGLTAQDIIAAIDRRQTGRALNLAKGFCTRLDKLELAARQPNMVQVDLFAEAEAKARIDTEAETQPIIARARLQDSTGVCPECGAIGYGDGNCLGCKVQVCREGTDNGRHVQR